MMLPAETQRATLRTRVVLLFALLWLGWRAGLGLLAQGGDARTIDAAWLARVLGDSEERRIEVTLAQDDGKQRLARGYHGALYRALVEHVAPATTVLVEVGEERGKVQVLATVGSLVYPRIFRMRRKDEAVSPAPRDGDHALVFGGGSTAEWEASFAPVANGPDWTLWKEREHGTR